MINTIQKGLKIDIAKFDILGGEQQRSIKRQSFILFEEDEMLANSLNPVNGKDDFQDTFCEPCPSLLIKRPFWNLRLIANSILYGGFLSDSVYMPKSAWLQHSLKFPGYAAKISAYQAILSLTSELQVLNIDGSLSNIEHINNMVTNAVEELHGIQNQLANPFPFIAEVKLKVSADETSSNLSRLSTIGNISSMMSILKKNVKKYAGLGLSRFNALPVLLTREEIQGFVLLMAHLCASCQVRSFYLL